MDKVKSRRGSGPNAPHIGFVVITLLLLAVLGSVPSAFSQEFGDNFRWHRELVAFFARIRYEAGDHVFHNTVRGDEGWIFFTGDASLKDYQHVGRLAPKDLERFRRNMDKLDSFVGQQQGTLLLVIAPDKSTTYPAFMPAQIPVLGTSSPSDQFVEYMGTSGSFPLLDLRPVLGTYANEGRLFYKTDTHWNELGAYFAYMEIMRALSPAFPDLSPRPLADFDAGITVARGRTDLPQIMGGLDLPDEVPALRLRNPEPFSTTVTRLSPHNLVVEAVNPSGPPYRLLIFGDSFSDSLRKFLMLDFGRVTTVPYNALSPNDFYDWILREHPDAVVIEVAERLLGNLIPKVAGAGR